MIVLDTNVYLDTVDDAAFAERLGEVVASHSAPVGVSSVVIAELLIGATSVGARTRVAARIVDMLESASVVTPTDADWQTAGDALSRLGGENATKGRSFWNDLFIAASCARVGATLLTRNLDDFRRIQRVVPVVVEPRPF